MIIDVDRADPLPLAGLYHVCIAGGGVAGIVLAYKLSQSGKRILLLEAGGDEFSAVSQDSYAGENSGLAYFDLDETRLRYLGGASNHWAGWCHPLEDYDFQRRDHIAGSGWPIGMQDLQPYLAETLDILEIDPFPPDASLGGAEGRLSETFYRRSPPVRFGRKYRKFLAASTAIDVLLNANLVDIERNPDNGRIEGFTFRGYTDLRPLYHARADQYVLALGGIENARILLNANRQAPHGPGNDHDLVGRYFMEHPHHNVGYFVADPARTDFGKYQRYVTPTPHMMDREGIGNAVVRLRTIDNPDSDQPDFIADPRELAREMLCAHDGIRDFVNSIRHLSCRPATSGVLRLAAEQVPNRNSRVMLSDQMDRFGLRRAALDWQLLPQDKQTIRTLAVELATCFARQDIGRVKLWDWVIDESSFDFPPNENGENIAANHHIGTTRMGSSALDGVVDGNCRVFGVDNLYVAGSSVFRTGGYANPTLTIVQLSLRLGDHLAQTQSATGPHYW